MGSTGNCCVALAVGLVLLAICSTGQALQCYNCPTWSASKCESVTTCASSVDGCMKISKSGTNYYSCRSYATCNAQSITSEHQIQNFELHCCQKDLCNGGFAAGPSAVLLLSLAVALLMMMS